LARDYNRQKANFTGRLKCAGSATVRNEMHLERIAVVHGDALEAYGSANFNAHALQ
jgi:hypothetical protein